MGVKELIDVYDSSRVQTPSSGAPRASDMHPQSSVLRSEGLSPSPARFLKHSHLRRREPSNTDDNDELNVKSPALVTNSDDITASPKDANDPFNDPEYSTDVVDELPAVSYYNDRPHPRGDIHGLPTRRSEAAKYESDEIPLLPTGRAALHYQGSYQQVDPFGGDQEDAFLARHSTPLQKEFIASSATLVQPVSPPTSHTPVPITTVLARTAVPLSLPKLDGYIASLDPPTLPPVTPSGRHKKKDIRMFPPMERLAATKKSLLDLETNTEDPPWWRDRSSIFSSLISMVLGIMVCFSECIRHAACVTYFA